MIRVLIEELFCEIYRLSVDELAFGEGIIPNGKLKLLLVFVIFLNFPCFLLSMSLLLSCLPFEMTIQIPNLCQWPFEKESTEVIEMLQDYLDFMVLKHLVY